ncbi:protein-tyrosine-phosphatase [Aeoliella sp. ICT_H6.2]|uniref:Protein-tyrosine-phosphatase n=1 Tax=Aeoliella straminimaris TaxID=2954799 RepID=A0A9X2FC44_9BACT|nr:protein-tyrosine-phosphatase [Aeoliella straminimaris]MCO6045337.1 protein-tyrosine-phosphatase [Aeoliella straminimaris]
MHRKLLWGLMVMTAAEMACGETPQWLEAAQPTVELLDSESKTLSPERRALLDEAADYVVHQLEQGKPANLIFICTHNSRRSQFGQVWAKVAADYHGLDNVRTYSGGTETTACNLRTVQAFRRAGLQVVATTGDDNPLYLAQYAEDRPALRLNSKVYSDQPDALEQFAAMMCCADADESCPVVDGAAVRVALHYIDPKVSDGTANESATYDERCRQIGSEMFYLFACVKRKLGSE